MKNEGNNLPSKKQDGDIPVTVQKMTVKLKQSQIIQKQVKLIRFLNAVMHYTDDGWRTIHSDDFSRIAYLHLGAGTTKSQIKDLEHLFFTSANDMTKFAHLIGMPDGRVWNMKKVDFTEEIDAKDCIFQLAISPTFGNSHQKWLSELTLNDEGLARDIMWSIAPIFMYKKPFGVFWYIGSGSNGKSTLLKTVYELFGGERKAPFTNMSLTAIEDGRDIPMMNGKLGNICLESHDGHIKDAGNYKHLGDHDNLSTHAMGQNHSLDVNGNIHTIFNTNNPPTFGDKSKAIRDRTFIIPFNAEFARDPTFDEKLWRRKDFLSDFLGDILTSAKALKKNGYKYRLSDASKGSKAAYDEEANTAEAYMTELIANKIWAFTNQNNLYSDYEVWCRERGSTLLGRRNLAIATKLAGYDRKSIRLGDDRIVKRYYFGDTEDIDVEPIAARVGLFQQVGANAHLNVREDYAGALLDTLLEALE